MFIRLRMMAHEALRAYMADDNRPPMSRRLTARIYKAITEAENNPGFANVLDNVCADAFGDQTAEGFGDLIQDFENPPEELAALLEKYLI